MIIHNKFIGGNVLVKEQTDTSVYLENEQRDTKEETNWFYWAFCVEGAEGKTVTFRFLFLALNVKRHYTYNLYPFLQPLLANR